VFDRSSNCVSTHFIDSVGKVSCKQQPIPYFESDCCVASICRLVTMVSSSTAAEDHVRVSLFGARLWPRSRSTPPQAPHFSSSFSLSLPQKTPGRGPCTGLRAPGEEETAVTSLQMDATQQSDSKYGILGCGFKYQSRVCKEIKRGSGLRQSEDQPVSDARSGVGAERPTGQGGFTTWVRRRRRLAASSGRTGDEPGPFS
jgi:hypothetical protein